MALLNFLGAIQQVTGSCYLIESRDGAKVLLECGMRQGRREEDEGNRGPFAFDPLSLDAVVVSHAHIDHTGLLPKLAAAGYRVGYESPSQFSREYSRQFGAPPVRDLARLRMSL